MSVRELDESLVGYTSAYPLGSACQPIGEEPVAEQLREWQKNRETPYWDKLTEQIPPAELDVPCASAQAPGRQQEFFRVMG